MTMILLLANQPDSWNDSDTSPEFTNMISVVLGKVESGDNRPFELLEKIANHLQWKLVDDYAGE